VSGAAHEAEGRGRAQLGGRRRAHLGGGGGGGCLPRGSARGRTEAPSCVCVFLDLDQILPCMR
jgi:hypothetical protein